MEAVKDFVIDVWLMKKTVNPEVVLDFIGRVFKNKKFNENVTDVTQFINRLHQELLFDKVQEVS